MTISELISQAILDSFREDNLDLQALDDAKNEKTYSLQEILNEFNLEHLK